MLPGVFCVEISPMIGLPWLLLLLFWFGLRFRSRLLFRLRPGCGPLRLMMLCLRPGRRLFLSRRRRRSAFRSWTLPLRLLFCSLRRPRVSLRFRLWPFLLLVMFGWGGPLLGRGSSRSLMRFRASGSLACLRASRSLVRCGSSRSLLSGVGTLIAWPGSLVSGSGILMAGPSVFITWLRILAARSRAIGRRMVWRSGCSCLDYAVSAELGGALCCRHGRPSMVGAGPHLRIGARHLNPLLLLA